MTFQQQATDYNSYYRVGKQLGKGGNAIVYEATDIATGEKVALKVLSSSGAERVARFANEISVASKYSATISGILPVLKSSEKYCWYSMPVAESVMTALDNHKSKGDRTLFAVMTVIELAMTLDQLHAAGIHHRDIKPDNIYMYNGRACLGDFGLVEFPDSGNNLTRDNRGLGAIFTIAPEMKRNPKTADGAKADVYSLAKTLWMLLSGDTKGFDGQYNWLDDTHRLHSFEPLDGEYFVEIERLLHSATDNNPARRPTMNELVLDLTEWTASRQSFDKRQNNEWDFLTDELFSGSKPQSATFTRIDDIISVLATVGRSPAYNHLLFSDGGGWDFTSAGSANEKGCIYVDTASYRSMVKPKALHMETFVDSRWNYFLLELDKLTPIFGPTNGSSEYLVEDLPAHYVDATDSVYGVYDYDSGVRLPDGWRRVTRYLSGSFMIVNKRGPYNRITKTYDGRHGVMSTAELRQYVDELQRTLAQLRERGISEETVIQCDEFGANPYPERMPKLGIGNEDREKLPDGAVFTKDNFASWNFSDLLNDITPTTGNLIFYFAFEPWCFHLGDFLDTTQKVLSSDGRIRSVKTDNLDGAFTTHSRQTAVRLLGRLSARLKELCAGYNISWGDNHHFVVKLEKAGSPSHLFTKWEIENKMREADDRLVNKLVIDEDGYAHVIPMTADGTLYPVSFGSWCPRNNYVGRYSDLPTLDSNYHNALACWLRYLKTGTSQFCDTDCQCDERQTIDEITKLMNAASPASQTPQD